MSAIYGSVGVFCAVLLLFVGVVAGDEIELVTEKDTQGCVVYRVNSKHQSMSTEIRVLLPDQFQAQQQYPVIYLLPVEAGRESRYGDSIAEVIKWQLHNQFQVIFVAPTFSQLPWYANHAQDEQIQQETYFIENVVPFIDRTYRIQTRYLLGFSKSGWGAWNLILRHPQLFERAAAWDAPLMMTEMGKYGTSGIFGTQKRFDEYRIDLQLSQAISGPEPRLILTGYGNFRKHHEETHELLNRKEIRHIYRDGPSRSHDWHSGWVAESVKLLLDTDSTP